jgi:hypothetical protein
MLAAVENRFYNALHTPSDDGHRPEAIDHGGVQPAK